MEFPKVVKVPQQKLSWKLSGCAFEESIICGVMLGERTESKQLLLKVTFLDCKQFSYSGSGPNQILFSTFSSDMMVGNRTAISKAAAGTKPNALPCGRELQRDLKKSKCEA